MVPQVGVLADLWFCRDYRTGLGVPRPVAPRRVAHCYLFVRVCLRLRHRTISKLLAPLGKNRKKFHSARVAFNPVLDPLNFPPVRIAQAAYHQSLMLKSALFALDFRLPRIRKNRCASV